MTATTAAENLSSQEIIEQYVAGMCEEFEKAEVEVEPVAARIRDRSDAAHQKRHVAMWDGRAPLVPADFFEVDCRELTTDGVSFWMEYPPPTAFIVVQVEVNGEVVFLKARVLHANPDLTVDNARYLVAARLSGRVNPGFSPESNEQQGR